MCHIRCVLTLVSLFIVENRDVCLYLKTTLKSGVFFINITYQNLDGGHLSADYVNGCTITETGSISNFIKGTRCRRQLDWTSWMWKRILITVKINNREIELSLFTSRRRKWINSTLLHFPYSNCDHVLFVVSVCLNMFFCWCCGLCGVETISCG